MNPAVRRAYAEFDVTVAALVRSERAKGTSIPCKAACDACCYDVAWGIPEEVGELVERVRSMPSAKRDAVLGRARSWLDGMRAAGLDPDKKYPDVKTYHRAHLPCPMLDVEHHACMAYDIRPLACRGHYVQAPDASPCANRGNEPVIDTVEFPNAITTAMMTILPTVAQLRHAQSMLLPRALGLALGIT